MAIRINCDKTRSGLPSMSEEMHSNPLGGITATIIANPIGKEKKAIYIPKTLNTLSGKHAYFVVKQNDLKIDVKRLRDSIQVKIYRIRQFLSSNTVAELEEIERYDSKNLDLYKESPFKRAIEIAIDKTKIFHPLKPSFYLARNKESHWLSLLDGFIFGFNHIV